MRRSIIVGLTLVIVGLAAASNVAAATFRSELAPEYLRGQQVESTRFRFPSTHFGEFFFEPICTEGNANGQTTTLLVEQIQLLPTYSGCTTQALPMTIEMNGCGYTVAPTGSGEPFGASLKLTCPAEKQIVFKFVNGLEVCKIFMGPQTPAESKFELRNEGGPKQVHWSGTAKGLSYLTQPSSGTNCGSAAKNAEIVLNLAVKGYANEARTEQVGFWVE